MINRQRRSAPSRFQFQIPTLFTLAAAKDCIGLIFRSATAFTNRLTLERRGHILDWATVNRSHSWLSIQKKMCPRLSSVSRFVNAVARSEEHSLNSSHEWISYAVF